MIDRGKLKGTQEDCGTIKEIVDRIERALAAPIDRSTYTMDLEVVHGTIGLRLSELLVANDSDFWHDIRGIAYHLDRRTGKLSQCFAPRYSARK